jgi:Effector-associated domain 11
MKQTLRNLIAEGKTKQTIAQLRQLTKNDADLNAEVVQLSARFSAYEHQKRMAVEDPSVLSIELNKINNALLSVIERLDLRSGNLEGFPNVNPNNLDIEEVSVNH